MIDAICRSDKTRFRVSLHKPSIRTFGILPHTTPPLDRIVNFIYLLSVLLIVNQNMRRKSSTNESYRASRSPSSTSSSTSVSASSSTHNGPCSGRRRYSLTALMVTVVLISSIVPSNASRHRREVGWMLANESKRCISTMTYRNSPSLWNLPRYPTTTTTTAEILGRLRGGAKKKKDKEDPKEEKKETETEEDVSVVYMSYLIVTRCLVSEFIIYHCF